MLVTLLLWLQFESRLLLFTTFAIFMLVTLLLWLLVIQMTPSPLLLWLQFGFHLLLWLQFGIHQLLLLLLLHLWQSHCYFDYSSFHWTLWPLLLWPPPFTTFATLTVWTIPSETTTLTTVATFTTLNWDFVYGYVSCPLTLFKGRKRHRISQVEHRSGGKKEGHFLPIGINIAAERSK